MGQIPIYLNVDKEVKYRNLTLEQRKAINREVREMIYSKVKELEQI